MTNTTKYPEITVQLIGEDGNAFAILGAVAHKLKSAGVPADEIAKFQEEATSGDYSNLLVTVGNWVTIH